MQYQVLRVDVNELEETLNAQSLAGWAVVALFEHNYRVVLVMAKPVERQ